MPTPLKGTDFISMGSASLGAKMVAKVNTPIRNVGMDYRLDIHGSTAVGLWFEVGPSGEGAWDGAMFGVDSGEIDFHGVGEAGKLPMKTVLEYQMRGLKLGLGDTEYTAWAVKNVINADTSYYVRVRETPSRILFGSYSAGEEATVHNIQLS